MPLTDVMIKSFNRKMLATSMRTSLMVFDTKSDRLKETASHTLSPLQLVAGSDRRIHHGINMARSAISLLESQVTQDVVFLTLT